MDLEHMTKQQMILLALLLSFVTSIATGIVTVSLVNQAPEKVTQTINRVVEKTIEKVVSPSITSKEKETTVKETIVVSVDDQVTASIEKNSKSVLRIYKLSTESQDQIFVSLGIVVGDDGLLITDNGAIKDDVKYFINGDDGKSHELSILRNVSGEQISLLKIKSDDKPLVIPKATISSSDVKLGQTVVYIGGEARNIVSTGIVSVLGTKDIKSDSASSTEIAKSIVSSIRTNIEQGSLISGGVLLNLSGDIVGLRTVFPEGSRNDLFLPAGLINNIISAYSDSLKKAN